MQTTMNTELNNRIFYLKYEKGFSLNEILRQLTLEGEIITLGALPPKLKSKTLLFLYEKAMAEGYVYPFEIYDTPQTIAK